MHKSRFLCLAVSRRNGANCIAGVDIDSGQWIRPVYAIHRGALGDSDIVVSDRGNLRIMAPLDLIELHLGESAGIPGQPENWTLNPVSGAKAHSVLCRAGDDPSLFAIVRNMAEASSSISMILGTPDNKVPHSSIEKESVKYSLCVIRPRDLVWSRALNFQGKPRIEALFSFGSRSTRYRLPVTDIAWEPKLLERTTERTTLRASESPGMDANREMLLTVSLGDHFRETGFHYKLIAGVLSLSKK
jgi:hypothetical protein